MEFLIFIAIFALIFVLRFKLGSHAARRKIDLSVLPERFVVFDLETTGLDPGRHRVIEIGAIRVNRDSDVHDTFSALIRIDKKVPKKITEITGITTDMLRAEGRPLNEVITEFIDFAGDLRLVAFNAPFDTAFLANALLDCGKTMRNDVSCALDMARRAWPGRRSYRLSALIEDSGRSTTGAHRALADYRHTVTVYTAAASILRRVD
ncbi:MAG: 3'-5' exonuclease [Burkholderiales bacterium]|nr:3'-5' exonuclease [Burkholderiales bacterium]